MPLPAYPTKKELTFSLRNQSAPYLVKINPASSRKGPSPLILCLKPVICTIGPQTDDITL
ncbi:hypothetical protein HMPREF1548_00750 [Clostridium sp. KLE 1755]|nr:hypothetical protein HMPREF1548_00750 [Clostridium sp. KLE 1755]